MMHTWEVFLLRHFQKIVIILYITQTHPHMAEEKTEKKVGIGMPITFSEFAKEPVKGVMFLCLVAVGYLYVDLKLNYNNQIEKQGEKIEMLEAKIDALTQQLRRSDSLQSAANSKLMILQELGKIK